MTADLKVDRHTVTQLAQRVMARCDELASFTDTAGAITRLYCSPAMAGAHGRLRTWMVDAGMECHLDSACNLIGRYTPDGATGSERLLIGSHLDTVPHGGRYDGVLGVLLAVALVELLDAEGRASPPIDVIGFAEEEGIRYRKPYLGSLAVVGAFDPLLLDLPDSAGIAMREAIAQFGGDPENLSRAAYDPDEVLGYIEPHIEQGPTLEQVGAPVGVVSAIAGQTRAALSFSGVAGHVGTVPIAARRDALAGSAEWILGVEELASRDDQLFATVARIEVHPNVPNVIPAVVQLRLDVRHPDDQHRETAVKEIFDFAQRIASRRHLRCEVTWTDDHAAVVADAALSQRLAEAAQQTGVPPQSLPSGAGHDAAIMASRFPMAMLFVRCTGGVSHHPDEAVDEADVAVALEVLFRAVGQLC